MMLRRLFRPVTQLTPKSMFGTGLMLGLAIGGTLAFGTAMAACSDSSEPSGGDDAGQPDTGGGGKDSGSDSGHTGMDAGTDSGALNNCTAFLDRSAESASRKLTWDFSIATSDERCLKIKAGQTVTFANAQGDVADFTTHPVEAKGGDTPNPVTELDTATGEVTFPNAGTFGFVCGNHPQMLGVFSVVP